MHRESTALVSSTSNAILAQNRSHYKDLSDQNSQMSTSLTNQSANQLATLAYLDTKVQKLETNYDSTITKIDDLINIMRSVESSTKGNYRSSMNNIKVEVEISIALMQRNINSHSGEHSGVTNFDLQSDEPIEYAIFSPGQDAVAKGTIMTIPKMFAGTIASSNPYKDIVRGYIVPSINYFSIAVESVWKLALDMVNEESIKKNFVLATIARSVVLIRS